MKVWNLQRVFGVVGADVAERLARTSKAFGAGQRTAADRTRAGNSAFRLTLAFVLTQASILGGLSPFGVAFVAAQTSGMTSLFSVLGAALGYLMLGMDVGLRYIAVCILTISAAMVFRGTKISESRFFIPGAAFTLSAVTGVLYWMGRNTQGSGIDPMALALLVTELLLTLGCSFLFRMAFAPPRDSSGDGSYDTYRAGGMLAICACTLLALSGILLADTLSPARMAAVCAVLLCAYRGGPSAGAATGLCMGLVMDLGLGTPFYSMSYGSAGMLSGAFNRAGKLLTAMAFVCTGAISALWAFDGAHRLSVMLEAFIASVVFMLINNGAFPRLDAILKVKRTENTLHAERLRDFAGARLESTAAAFQNVSSALDAALMQADEIYGEGIENVFDRATKEVCSRCARVEQCWDTELPATCAALRDAAKRCEGRGRLDKNDLSGYFASRCLHFKQLISVGNRELSLMLYRRRQHARIHHARGVLCRQYAEFAHIISNTANQLEAAPKFDAEAERRLMRLLQNHQLTAQVSVYATASGRMCAEISGENLSILLTDKREFVRQVSRTLGWMVNTPEEECVASLNRLVLWESEPVLATLGVAAHKKGGQSVSGDTGTYFKSDEGKLYVILADGMGSGSEAARDSRQAVRLLEGFLRAGIGAESALEAMNSSLLLGGAEDAVFVTFDLLVVDLLDASLTSYKYGAAPTYIMRNGHVSRVEGAALPGGLDSDQKPDIFSQKLTSDQWVIMISDGIAVPGDDEWLTETVALLNEDDSPRDAASRILQQAIRRGGASDDMTALALRTRTRRTRVR